MGKRMHKPLLMTRKNVEWVIERKKRVAFKRIRCEIWHRERHSVFCADPHVKTSHADRIVYISITEIYFY